MEKIAVQCTQCEAVLKVSPEVLGKKARCPKCKSVILLKPAAGEAGTEAQLNSSTRSTSTSSAPPETANPPSTEGKTNNSEAAPSENSAKVDDAVPMAKLLPTAKPKASVATNVTESGAGAGQQVKSEESVDFSALGASDKQPRVKFKRKRSNPLPTIILGVIAISVLGIAVALIAILQQGGDKTADPNAIPQIVFVSDIKAGVGEQVSIPIQVQYPPSMTMQQTNDWKVALGPDAPEGAVYDEQAKAVNFAATYLHAGTSQVIPVQISDNKSDRSEETRFSVIVESISEGEKQFLKWVAETRAAGRTISVLPRKTVGVLSGVYRDAVVESVSIRAFFFMDETVAQQALSTFDQDNPEMAMAIDGFEKPIVVGRIGPALLIGNDASVHSDATTETLFKDDVGEQAPSESAMTEETGDTTDETDSTMEESMQQSDAELMDNSGNL